MSGNLETWKVLLFISPHLLIKWYPSRNSLENGGLGDVQNDCSSPLIIKRKHFPELRKTIHQNNQQHKNSHKQTTHACSEQCTPFTIVAYVTCYIPLLHGFCKSILNNHYMFNVTMCDLFLCWWAAKVQIPGTIMIYCQCGWRKGRKEY